MSDIDFQNGFICGMATRGLTKAYIDVGFLSDHKYYFVTDTFQVSSIGGQVRGQISDILAASTQTPVARGPEESFMLSDLGNYIVDYLSDSTNAEIT